MARGHGQVTDKTFISTKTYDHSLGLSCAFRQWRAESHCRFLHGYSIAVHFEFETAELDFRHWAVDFGSLKSLKGWLEDMLDHKTLIAEDDPALPFFRQGHELGVMDLVVVPYVGCERFAEMIFDAAEVWLQDNGYSPRVRLRKVQVKEHGANSAMVVRSE
jgi:6-pyruvoyltetrahydropterin/6-carboxytetrahydropterin synthase